MKKTAIYKYLYVRFWKMITLLSCGKFLIISIPISGLLLFCLYQLPHLKDFTNSIGGAFFGALVALGFGLAQGSWAEINSQHRKLTALQARLIVQLNDIKNLRGYSSNIKIDREKGELHLPLSPYATPSLKEPFNVIDDLNFLLSKKGVNLINQILKSQEACLNLSAAVEKMESEFRELKKYGQSNVIIPPALVGEYKADKENVKCCINNFKFSLENAKKYANEAFDAIKEFLSKEYKGFGAMSRKMPTDS